MLVPRTIRRLSGLPFAGATLITYLRLLNPLSLKELRFRANLPSAADHAVAQSPQHCVPSPTIENGPRNPNLRFEAVERKIRVLTTALVAARRKLEPSS